ncbi:MAG TPA: PAS domain S-box protein [Bacteroidales bacterium]|nr:PAS domain S-box protein [Bacteroidales bacterium]HNZ42832.1 PAS domain S-box protein [Bacteroidales bacterium]HPB26338.1 PAS domain S-box protein [Bacteroidales bacterium]HPI30535.1 PAS domain S-box protein [Bacteroidales bacterium]HQN17099.1 PAS domain S-box protein [Bacteroidales bacterium]
MMPNIIILILTTVILIFTLVFIFRMLDYVKSRMSWVMIGLAIIFLTVAQLMEVYNIYFNQKSSFILTLYFLLVLVVAVLLSISVHRIGNLLRSVKKADERRIESENRFKLLFDNSTDEIFLADFDGNFIEVNQEVIKRLGYSREELMKKNFTDIKTPKYIPLVKKNIDIIIQNGHHIYETEHLTKKGSVIFLEMSSRVIDYFGKKAILSLARDITDRKEIERKIAAAIIETEERERQRFAADLHDGLAPLLSTIKLYTDLLKKGNFNKISPAETLQAVDELIDKAIVSTREISNNIMPSILQDFGLPVAIRDFCNYINNTQSVKIMLDTSQYKLSGTRIEETVLFQSIKELVNNSLKHSRAKNIEIYLESHERQVNLFYKDDGIGFDVEDKLQQPTGMGLNNIVNKIKTINGLTLIKSKEGEGMSVLVTVNVK